MSVTARWFGLHDWMGGSRVSHWCDERWSLGGLLDLRRTVCIRDG